MGKNKKIIDFGDRGKYNSLNKLNHLTGKEWIKFTKSWFIHKPTKRKKDVELHPAKFPESLAREFIEFFTKKDQWVLDPFAGTGSTLIASGQTGRNAVGIELIKKYFEISEKRIHREKFSGVIKIINDSSVNLPGIIKKQFTEKKFDYILTSPPYWNQLKRNHMRQNRRKDRGIDTQYSSSSDDLGNIDDYEKFLDAQARIFDQVYKITKNLGYLTIITNNIYFNSKLYPLAFDTAKNLTCRGEFSWVLKDEKIWLQDDKALVALGINNAWVGNRHHQYCLIFRKEDKNG